MNVRLASGACTVIRPVFGLQLFTGKREIFLRSAAGWHVQGALSCAHWLAWRVGWGLRTARERVRVARKLEELPLLDEQPRIGAISYSQARVISRVATADKEHIFVAYAKRMPASQRDKLGRSYQNVQAYDQAHETGAMAGAMAAAQVVAQRTVTRRSLDNGIVKFEVVLPSDEAAIVWAALNAAIDTSSAKPIDAEHPPAKPPAAKAPTSVARGRQRATAFMDIIQDRVRGAHPQLTPIEIIITVPHAGLHGSENR